MTLCAKPLDSAPADPQLLDLQVRESLAAAVASFDSLCKSDESGLAVAPARQRVRTGYERGSNVVVTSRYRLQITRYRDVPRRYREVVDRYSKKRVEVPVYENVYGDAIARTAAGESVDRKEALQRRKRVTGTKQVSVKMVETEVSDPNGAIRRTRLVPDDAGPIVQGTTRVLDEKGPIAYTNQVPDPAGNIVVVYTNQLPGKPIYSGEHEVWSDGLLGQNALVLYALLECGVSSDSEVMRRLASQLTSRCETYGMPDTTWDLAWLTAALSNYAAKQVDPGIGKRAEALAGKLMNGQITDGPARGLWGPVSINTRLLKGMIEYELKLTDKINGRQGKPVAGRAAVDPKRHSIGDKPSRPAQQKKEEPDLLHSFQANYQFVTTQGREFERIQAPFRIDPPMGQPDVTLPGLPVDIYTWAMADLESTALAMFALAEAFEHGFLPAKTPRPTLKGTTGSLVLPAESSDAVIARAVNAVCSLRNEAGKWSDGRSKRKIDHFKGVFESITRDQASHALNTSFTSLSAVQANALLCCAARIVGRKALQSKHSEPMAAAKVDSESALRLFLENNSRESASYCVYPYDMFLAWTSCLEVSDVRIENDRDLWLRAASALVSLRQLAGNWGEGTSVVSSSSLREIGSALPTMNAQLVATAYSMIFLADRLRPPVAGYWSSAGTEPPPKTLSNAVKALTGKLTVPLTITRLGPKGAPSRPDLLPVVVVDGLQPTSPWQGEGRHLLASYLRAGGTVVVQAAATPEGIAFLAESKKQLCELVASSPGKLARNDALLQGIPGAESAIDVVGMTNGLPRAILLQVATEIKGGAGAVSQSSCNMVLTRLLTKKVDPDILRKDYASVASFSRGGAVPGSGETSVRNPSAPAFSPAAVLDPDGLPLPPVATESPAAADEQL